MRLDLRITYADGSVLETAATTPDFIEYEKEWDRSVTNLDTDLRYTDLCWLAWQSAIRQGKETAEFNAWVHTVDGVAMTDGEAAPVPLEQTAPTSA